MCDNPPPPPHLSLAAGSFAATNPRTVVLFIFIKGPLLHPHLSAIKTSWHARFYRARQKEARLIELSFLRYPRTRGRANPAKVTAGDIDIPYHQSAPVRASWGQRAATAAAVVVGMAASHPLCPTNIVQHDRRPLVVLPCFHSNSAVIKRDASRMPHKEAPARPPPIIPRLVLVYMVGRVRVPSR